MYQAALAAHIALGTACLLLAPLALRSALRSPRATHSEVAFCHLVAALCVVATWLSLTEAARLWPFILVSGFTLLFAARSRRGIKREDARSRVDRLAGTGGATIALVTAVLVVSAPFLGPAAWLLPAAIGAPLLHRAETRVGAPTPA